MSIFLYDDRLVSLEFKVKRSDETLPHGRPGISCDCIGCLLLLFWNSAQTSRFSTAYRMSLLIAGQNTISLALQIPASIPW